MAAKAGDENFLLRPVTVEDLDAMVELFTRNDYELPSFRTQRFLHWQYFQGVLGPAIMWGAFDGPILVGLYNLALSQISILGRRRKSAFTLGTLTDQAYRSRLFRTETGLETIFTRLARLAFEEACRQEVALTYGFPNENSYSGFVKHLGFHDVGTLSFLVRPIYLRDLPRQRIRLPGPLDRLAAAAAQCFAAGLVPRPREDGGLDVRVMPCPDEQLDDLSRRMEDSEKVMLVRDRAYLTWRLFNHPVYRYEVLGAYRRGRLEGYLAWMIAQRTDRRQGRTATLGHIVDYVCPPDGSGGSALDTLLRAAEGRIRRHRPMMIVAVTTPTPHVIAAFQRCGYLALSGRFLPHQFPCVVKTHRLPEPTHVVRRWGNWYITFVDNDVA